MEFQRPPRPRRSVHGVATNNASHANAFDPVGAVARIWAGLENDVPVAPAAGPARHRSRSSSRQRTRELETPSMDGDADELERLRASLRTEEAELQRSRQNASDMRRELEEVAQESAEALASARAAWLTEAGRHEEEQLARLRLNFQEELSHQLLQHDSEANERFHGQLALEVAEEVAKAKKVWTATTAADSVKEKAQQEEFQRLLEAKFTSQTKDEVQQLRAALTQEFAEHEEAIRQLWKQRDQEEVEQQRVRAQDEIRTAMEEATHAFAAREAEKDTQWREEAKCNCEDELQEQEQRHRMRFLQEEDHIKKEMQAQLHLEMEAQQQKLEAQSMERLECQAAQAVAIVEAEELVQHLEEQEARAGLRFENELEKCRAQYTDASNRSSGLEALLQAREEAMEEEVAARLSNECGVLEDRYEQRVREHLEDCQEVLGKHERDAEAEIQSRLQDEIASELSEGKEAQISRLQKLMEKKLAEGLAKQKVIGEEAAEALAQREGDVMQLRQELLEAKKRRALGGGQFEDFQAEELQKLLEMAHGENSELRETIVDLRGEINTQAGEIKLLEERVLDTLSGLRDGSRAPSRSNVPGPPRASSMPSKCRETGATGTPPSRAQPGDIRRLPPQPKLRVGSNAV